MFVKNALCFAVVCTLASPIFAQEATPTEPTAPEGITVGTPYLREQQGDWAVECLRRETPPEPCEMTQRLTDINGNPVADVRLFTTPAGGPAAAGASIMTPLMTLLTENLRMQIDNGPVKTYPFAWCEPQGCVARMGFTPEDLALMKSGTTAKIVIVPVAAQDQTVALTLSLKGFTAGFAALTANGTP